MEHNGFKKIEIKDFSVSSEKFFLVENEEYGYLETHPKPSLENVSKYYETENYISHTDSSESFIDKIYQNVRVHTLSKKVQLINSFNTTGKSLLDIGCGTGDFLLAAKSDNWEVTGVEPDEGAREISTLKLNKKVFALEDLVKLKGNTYDVISLWHVMEHIYDLDNQMDLICSLLKPNGVLIIAVPNYKSFDAKYYKQYWAALDVPRHLYHFNKISIKKFFKKRSLNVVKTKPMWFDAFYISLISEKYKGNKLGLLKFPFIGMLSNFYALFGEKNCSSQIYILKR